MEKMKEKLVNTIQNHSQKTQWKGRRLANAARLLDSYSAKFNVLGGKISKNAITKVLFRGGQWKFIDTKSDRQE